MSLAALLMALALPVLGQGLGEEHFKPAPPDATPPSLNRALPETRPPVTSIETGGAVLRGLDKMTGRVTEFEMAVGETRRFERLEITLSACRRPGPGEGEDAYAWLEIRDMRDPAPAFKGWMFASSPALSALDHPRYDVWVARCSTSDDEVSTDNAQN